MPVPLLVLPARQAESRRVGDGTLAGVVAWSS